MSAIVGLYFGSSELADTMYRSILMDAMQLYPSNESAVWYDDQVFLGCNNQWITPESIGEILPYYDPETQLSITADAIIDNRQELFNLLRIEADRRQSMTDSELILLSYMKWGDDSPQYLIGDFAYVIWDRRAQRLFGARDFSGSRTLYYNQTGDKFAFCTVMEPLLTLPYVKRELNEVWLAEYLAITGMVDVVTSSSTVYKTVFQVPPSYSISISGRRIKLNRYCTLKQDKLKLKSDGEYVEAFREIFQEAVTNRLRTYRGVSAQLSGGLDSGAIVSFAVKALSQENKKLHTFSYIPTKDFKSYYSKSYMVDESPLIQATVDHVGGISSHFFDFAGSDSLSEVNEFLGIMEMPYKFFENSFWLRGMYEKAREQNAGILLNGGRGNMSISWGPASDYYAVLLKRLKWVRLGRELHEYSYKAGVGRMRRIPQIAEIAFPSISRWRTSAESYQLPSIINPELARRTDVYHRLQEYGIGSDGWLSTKNAYEQRKEHFESLFHWNASNTLAAKLSLRYGVWKRDPTNDLRVIRFCLSVPEEQYVQNGMDRALVRRATEGYLPDQVRLNQRTRGVQGADWVHRMIPEWARFTTELEQMIKDSAVAELLNIPQLKQSFELIKGDVRPEGSTDVNYRILMRSLIVYRFIKQLS